MKHCKDKMEGKGMMEKKGNREDVMEDKKEREMKMKAILHTPEVSMDTPGIVSGNKAIEMDMMHKAKRDERWGFDTSML